MTKAMNQCNKPIRNLEDLLALTIIREGRTLHTVKYSIVYHLRMPVSEAEAVIERLKPLYVANGRNGKVLKVLYGETLKKVIYASRWWTIERLAEAAKALHCLSKQDMDIDALVECVYNTEFEIPKEIKKFVLARKLRDVIKTLMRVGIVEAKKTPQNKLLVFSATPQGLEALKELEELLKSYSCIDIEELYKAAKSIVIDILA